MIIIYILAALSIIGTFLPYIDHPHWIVRGQSYFKGVYLATNILLFLIIALFGIQTMVKTVFLVLLLISIFFCIRAVIPFTRINSCEIPLTRIEGKLNPVNILIYNVYQFNNKYDNLIQLVKREEPDILFLVETNTDWAKGVEELKSIFPYHFDEIRENTYGLMFFSKIEIKEGGINYLVKPDIPSAEALLDVNGVKVRIMGLHPQPPVPGEALTSHYKDRELAQAARYLNGQIEDDHQILIGDLNDVAWSRASLYFKKATGMKDPRVGRGFYSTFPTWFPIKIPLDHVFCSEDLKLIDFKILEDIGSDHYPVNVKFHAEKKK